MKPTGKKIKASLKAISVLSLLFLRVAGHVSIVMAQSPGTFIATGSMTMARAEHTATLLTNGTVLIAGGSWETPPYFTQQLALASAELYDPFTGTFRATGDMTTARFGHTATLLPNGKVLIAGGWTGTGPLTITANAEIYDPSKGTFTATGDMITAQLCRTATLLDNGKVLFARGETYSSPVSGSPVSGTELYDPAAGTFGTTSTDADAQFSTCPSATLLPDGRVLFAGGGTPELYDPGTGTFSLTGGMTEGKDAETATLLMNGKVLLAGGSSDFGRYSTAELYDPATGTFTSTGDMACNRASHTATLLPDGGVLVAGGESQGCLYDGYAAFSSSASAELYDPSTGSFVAAGDMSAHREGHTSTLLNDGRVLIAGGEDYGCEGCFFGSLATSELYVPPLLMPAPTLLSVSGDRQQQGAILHAITQQVASPDNPAVAEEALEIYLTGLAEGSVIPPQVTIGGRMADVLFFGKAPGLSGVNQVNIRVPSGVDPGPAVPVRLIYIGRPSNEVTIGVR